MVKITNPPVVRVYRTYQVTGELVSSVSGLLSAVIARRDGGDDEGAEDRLRAVEDAIQRCREAAIAFSESGLIGRWLYDITRDYFPETTLTFWTTEFLGAAIPLANVSLETVDMFPFPLRLIELYDRLAPLSNLAVFLEADLGPSAPEGGEDKASEMEARGRDLLPVWDNESTLTIGTWTGIVSNQASRVREEFQRLQADGWPERWEPKADKSEWGHIQDCLKRWVESKAAPIRFTKVGGAGLKWELRRTPENSRTELWRTPELLETPENSRPEPPLTTALCRLKFLAFTHTGREESCPPSS